MLRRKNSNAVNIADVVNETTTTSTARNLQSKVSFCVGLNASFATVGVSTLLSTALYEDLKLALALWVN